MEAKGPVEEGHPVASIRVPHDKTANPVHRICKIIVHHPLFDSIMLLIIILNGVLMAAGDYTHVDSTGQLVPEGSTINTINDKLEGIFTGIYCFEFVLKILGLGIFKEKGSYFRSVWNWLDFIIVITSLISIVTTSPGGKALRVFRVLRPLKSIKSYPELALIVKTLIRSIPALLDISLFLLVLMFFFGVIGIQYFNGPYLHSVCRLTPYPVNTSWTFGLSDPAPYRCLLADNFNLAMDFPHMTKEESPWYQPPANCYWPKDGDNTRLCSLSGHGKHKCYHDIPTLNTPDWRWCGSDYDAWGNFRFATFSPSESATFNNNLQFGVNFDNFKSALIIVFFGLTTSCWTTFMYMVNDSISFLAGAAFFSALIFLGPFFIMQLLIVVLKYNYRLEIKKHESTSKYSTNVFYDNAVNTVKIRTCVWIEYLKNSKGGVIECIRNAKSRVDPIFEWTKNIVDSSAYENLVMGLVLINTIILALDHHPMDDTFGNTLDAINFLLTTLFVGDLVLKMAGLGVVSYLSNSFYAFDFIIVVASIADVMTSPIPTYLSSSTSNADGSGQSLSALRSLRLLRLLRLLKSKKFQQLFKKILLALDSMKYFLVLLILFFYIFALIGMQFFSNRLRFDKDGIVIDTIGSTAWINAASRPRHNFDDFSHSFATVFQIATLDNWNAVLYSVSRSQGELATIFVFANVVLGAFVLLNLFVGVLIDNFCDAPINAGLAQALAETDETPMSINDNEEVKADGTLIWDGDGNKHEKKLPPREESEGVGKWENDVQAHSKHSKELPSSATPLSRGTSQQEREAEIGAEAEAGYPSAEINSMQDNKNSSQNEREPETHSNANALCRTPILSMTSSYNERESEAVERTNSRKSTSIYEPLEGCAAKVVTPPRLATAGEVIAEKGLTRALIYENKSSETVVFRESNSNNMITVDRIINYLDAVEKTQANNNNDVVSLSHDNSQTIKNVDNKDELSHIDFWTSRLAVRTAARTGSNRHMAEDAEEKVAGGEKLVRGVKNSNLSKSSNSSQNREKDEEYTPGDIFSSMTGSLWTHMSNLVVVEWASSQTETIQTTQNGNNQYLDEAVDDKKSDVHSNIHNRGSELSSSSKFATAFARSRAKMSTRSSHIALLQMYDELNDDDCDNDAQMQSTVQSRETVLEAAETQPKPDDVKMQLQEEVSWWRFELRLFLNSYLCQLAVFSLVVATSITVSYENPLSDHTSHFIFKLYSVDLVATALLLWYSILKIIAFGLWENEGGFLLEYWNIVDLIITLLAYPIAPIVAFAGGTRGGGIRVLTSLRALRPVLCIRWIHGLKSIVDTCVLAMPSVKDIFMIFVLVYFCFSIFLVSFLKGQLRSCVISSLPSEVYSFAPYSDDAHTPAIGSTSPYMDLLITPSPWESLSAEQKSWFGPNSTLASYNSDSCSQWPEVPCCPNWPMHSSTAPTSRVICECWGGRWEKVINRLFDDVGTAFFSLYQLGTLDSWTSVMYAAVDSTGIDMQPVRDSSIMWIYLFIIFVILGTFLNLNFFVTVVCEQFMILSERGRDAFTEDWKALKQLILKTMPVKNVRTYRSSDNLLRTMCYDLVETPYFKNFIFILVLLQCAALCSSFLEMSSEFQHVLLVIDVIFASLFILEAILKLAGYGKAHYFHNAFNILDFSVAVGLLIGFLIYASRRENGQLVLAGVRVLRLPRAFSLMMNLGSLAKLVNTVFQMIPSLFNVSVLLFIILYIFGLFGHFQFAKVGYFNTYNAQASFRTMHDSYLVMMRLMCGEGWSDYMYDLTHKELGCEEDPQYNTEMCGFNDFPGCKKLNGCGDNTALAYLSLYTLFVNLIFLNVFLSFVLSFYSKITNATISNLDIELFIKSWSNADPYASGFIDADQLADIVKFLPLPLGFDGKAHSKNQLLFRIGKIPLYADHTVNFTDVLLLLCATQYEKYLLYNDQQHKRVIHVDRNLDNDVEDKTSLENWINQYFNQVYTKTPFYTPIVKNEGSKFLRLSPVNRHVVTINDVVSITAFQRLCRSKMNKLRDDRSSVTYAWSPCSAGTHDSWAWALDNTMPTPPVTNSVWCMNNLDRWWAQDLHS